VRQYVQQLNAIAFTESQISEHAGVNVTRISVTVLRVIIVFISVTMLTGSRGERGGEGKYSRQTLLPFAQNK
jgi:hypothetical protein